jgi:soluble lytic murein transglycosylase-like protein
VFSSIQANGEQLIVPPKHIVDIANSLAYPDFPTTLDIISIIRVESAFNANAINPERSSHRGASMGLMQVQRGSLNVSTNMHKGVALLREYYIRLGRDKAAAVKSYNIGIGAYKKGKATISASQYYAKFRKRRAEYIKYYVNKVVIN